MAEKKVRNICGELYEPLRVECANGFLLRRRYRKVEESLVWSKLNLYSWLYINEGVEGGALWKSEMENDSCR